MALLDCPTVDVNDFREIEAFFHNYPLGYHKTSFMHQELFRRLLEGFYSEIAPDLDSGFGHVLYHLAAALPVASRQAIAVRPNKTLADWMRDWEACHCGGVPPLASHQAAQVPTILRLRD